MTRKQLVKMVSDFLVTSPMAVLSTSGPKGKSEAALIIFAHNKHLEIFFETEANSRKYKNLLKKPHVALVVGWDAAVHLTIQYEGTARELSGVERKRAYEALIDKKTPIAWQLADGPKSRLFKITPTWIRWSDYRSYPPSVEELTFKK